MNIDVDYEKLFEFSSDLNQGFILCSNNVEFRLRCLKLLQKHYGYQHLSFNVYEASIKTPAEFKLPSYDNVTLGLSKKLVSDYYSHYQNQDFLMMHGKTRNFREIFRLSDVVSDQEFEHSNFYQNLYKKHGVYYQVVMAIMRDQEAIGVLSIVRGKSEGDFSEDEIRMFYPLRDLISRYIVNFLHIEIIKIENLAFRTYTKAFPIGHIIIDEKYKVTYANSNGAEYAAQLTGMPLEQFKYYYINQILPKIEKFSLEELVDASIELPNFYIQIKRELVEPHTWLISKQYALSLFIQKKILANLTIPMHDSQIEELTTREIEIVELIRQGKKNAEIAITLHLSEHTVKAHIQRIYGKVGVNSKTTLLHKISEII